MEAEANPIDMTLKESLSLRQLTIDDLAALYPMEYETAGASTRPLRPGRVLAPQHFASAIWEDALVNLVLKQPRAGVPVGLFTVFSADFRHGIAYGRLVVQTNVDHKDGELAAQLAIQYTFRLWPIRRLLFESLSTPSQFPANLLGDVVGPVEGRLGSHYFIEGQWVDVYVFGIDREAVSV